MKIIGSHYIWNMLRTLSSNEENDKLLNLIRANDTCVQCSLRSPISHPLCHLQELDSIEASTQATLSSRHHSPGT